MNFLTSLENFPLRKRRAVFFRDSPIQPFGGFKDVVESSVERRPNFVLTVPIRIEGQPDSMTITLLSRQCDEVCRSELDIDKGIEEIGPFYLQIQR